MGAPTSSILSELYFQFMEHPKLYTILLQNNILVYFRYVDDILVLYNDFKTDIDKFLDYFNNAMPAMTFSIEKETDNSINFLDITVHKSIECFSFSIHRKPTTTDTIIPNDSCHPPEHKHAAMHYMYNRMNSYQLSKSCKEQEYNIIRQNMYNNKYDPSILNNNNRIRHTKNKIRSGLNSHTCEKRLILSLSCSRISESKFHIPLIAPSIEFSTENQPIQKHKNSCRKVEFTGSHALTVT